MDDYEPYYLKLTLKEDLDKSGISDSFIDLIDEHPFGNFKPILGREDKGWFVFRYDYYSKQMDYGGAHNTKEDALAAAIKYLNEKGFNVRPFDLEGLIGFVK